MLDLESGWKSRFQDYRHIQQANSTTLVTEDSEPTKCNASYIFEMKNQRHIQNQRQIHNQTFGNDNPTRCAIKDLVKNSQSNKAVTSVTTTPKVCKCNEIDICIKTTFCYIQIHRHVFSMQFKILIIWTIMTILQHKNAHSI